jgi:hypothetical protein
MASVLLVGLHFQLYLRQVVYNLTSPHEVVLPTFIQELPHGTVSCGCCSQGLDEIDGGGVYL